MLWCQTQATSTLWEEKLQVPAVGYRAKYLGQGNVLLPAGRKVAEVETDTQMLDSEPERRCCCGGGCSG